MFISPSPRLRQIAQISCLLAILTALPAAADWLVLENGRMIETQGEWTLKENVVRYTDLEGRSQTLSADLVDVEGSRETTALKAGRTYQSPPKAPAARAPQRAQRARFPALEETDRSPVILYSTSWCGYCRKARKLLKDMDVDFEEKDIEKDRSAAVEMARKVGGRSGVPVLDVGGEILRGYSPPRIRQLVKDLNQALAESSP